MHGYKNTFIVKDLFLVELNLEKSKTEKRR